MNRFNVLLPAIVVFGVLTFTVVGIVVTMSGTVRAERALREAQLARATVLRHQLDQETGVRGYAATGNGFFLKPYNDALARFQSSVIVARLQFEQLHATQAAAALDDEEALHRQWLRDVAKPLISHPRSANALVLEFEGKRLIDRFRDDNDYISRVLNEAATTLERQQQATVTAFIIAGVLLGLALAGVVYLYAMRQRRAIADARRQTLLYEREREVAEMLQRAVIERELPTFNGLKVDTCYRAASEVDRVGGDWFDVFALRDGRMLLIVGDVVGHGLEATIAMRDTRNAIFGAAFHEARPGAILTAANRQILRRQSFEPVGTVICAFVDPVTRYVQYASAGHPPPLAINGRQARRLYDDGTLPLGLEECEYPTRSAQLPPASSLIFYTDGLTELTHDPLEGEERLMCCAVKLSESDELARAIVNDVLRDAAPSDDIAVVAIRFTGIGAEQPQEVMTLVKDQGRESRAGSAADSTQFGRSA